jgi:hypothetical protein
MLCCSAQLAATNGPIAAPSCLQINVSVSNKWRPWAALITCCPEENTSIRVFYITNEMQLIQCSLLLSALYMFRAVFRPSSEAYKTVCAALGIVMLSTAGVDGLEPSYPHQRQTAGKHNSIQSCTYSFISSWWWAEKPPETCRALIIIYYCQRSKLYTLHLVGFIKYTFGDARFIER